MEFTKQEVIAVQATILDRAEAACQELSEFELALVGGGQGDVQWN